MLSFRMDKIAGVDTPAQEGAVVTLMKRNDEDVSKFARPILLTEVDGHTHIIDLDQGNGGSSSYETAENEDTGHSHPWVMNMDGEVVVGASAGHSHQPLKKNESDKLLEEILIEDDGFNKRKFTAARRKELASQGLALSDGSYPIVNVSDLKNAIKAFGRAKNKGRVAAHIKRRAKALGASELLPEEGVLAKFLKSVDEKELQKMPRKKEDIEDTGEAQNEELEKVNAKLQAVEKKLEVAEAFGDLNDAEKEVYASLGKKEKADFLELGAEERKAEVAKRADENPVVCEVDGQVFRKNDDPRMIQIAKKAEKAAKDAAVEKAARENAEFAKRAESELDNLPGNGEVKIELLKAVEGIENEDIREGVTALLKAGNDGASGAFVRKGAKGEGEAEPEGNDDELEKLAKKYAEENDVSLAKARGLVLETPEGEAIYKKMYPKDFAE